MKSALIYPGVGVLIDDAHTRIELVIDVTTYRHFSSPSALESRIPINLRDLLVTIHTLTKGDPDEDVPS